RDGPRSPSSLARRAFRGAAAVAAEGPHAACGDGPSSQNARGQETLRLAQADARAGIRHHQIGARVPPVPAAWDRQCARRVEPRDHGVEHEADVRPGRRKLRPIRKLERQPSPLARPRRISGTALPGQPPDLPVRKRAHAPDLRYRREWPTVAHVTSLRHAARSADTSRKPDYRAVAAQHAVRDLDLLANIVADVSTLSIYVNPLHAMDQTT